MAKKSFLVLHPKDDLAVALTPLSAGKVIVHSDQTITLLTDVKVKHKFALIDFNKDSIMTQYGVPVGRALSDIKTGEAITTENTEHSSDDMCNWMPGYQAPPTDASKFEGQTFKGFQRADGQVGTRNNWLVIPLVFCENNNLMTLREVFNRELGFTDHSSYQDELRNLTELYKNGASVDDILNSAESSGAKTQSSNNLFPNVDGLKFLFHNMGCGGTNEDSQVLAQLLAGYIKHPNTAGATILSLGCQKTQMGLLESYLERLDIANKPIYFHEQQQIGTEQELISKAIKSTFAGLIQANQHQRQDSPLSKLVIGVECGASDGFSGISSNPAIGQVSDLIVKLGGSAVLSEFPELFGVEKEMIMRCKDEKTANTFIDLMRSYEARAEADGTSMSSNPSPGNIKDGLITDAMKSAGAAKKGGTAVIQDVQDYPGYITKKGLNLLNTPGNDVESCTALAGAGCNLILFSTGLGTPTGNPVTPVIKVSSNTKVAITMPDIIDFDTGCIISGEKSLEETGQDLLRHCIDVASGTTISKAEKLGQDDFIPWKRGTSL
ncbi:altronate dehydratase family protein [Lentisphaera profundi]|uniref:Altronate dehydratase family protein n=1 Tax=Lentisphaera profundi TaxID=1658616 RepID=A0ABY7VSU6_9BACT|nr:altronate dehydratase family protein [Lentisphaera profundi]WDE96976.1 altronate dehydratase family protein [Lentisphaera profundi]